jgi:hypothetical protein
VTILSLQAFEGSSYIGIIQNWKKPVAQEAFNAFCEASRLEKSRCYEI